MERSDMGAALVKAISGKSPEWTPVKIADPDEFTSTAVNSKQVPIPGPETLIRLDVSAGSKPEKLNESTCFPLFTQQRTSPRYFGMSVSWPRTEHTAPVP